MQDPRMRHGQRDKRLERIAPREANTVAPTPRKDLPFLLDPLPYSFSLCQLICLLKNLFLVGVPVLGFGLKSVSGERRATALVVWVLPFAITWSFLVVYEEVS